MVAPRAPAPLGPAVLSAVLTSPVPVLFLPPPLPVPLSLSLGRVVPLPGQVAVFGRVRETPRHRRGHGPRLPWLLPTGPDVSIFVDEIANIILVE